MTTTFDTTQLPVTSLQNINNILDNGGFEVWQRGTTFNGAGNAAYTADRWKNSYGGSPVANMTQESSTIHDGQYSMKVVITSAPGSSIWGMGQTVENYQSYRGKTLSFSCWVNTTMSNVNLVLYDGITLTAGAFHPGDGQWHQLTVTATMSASASLVVVFVTQETTGVTGTLYVDSAMLVIGSNASAFIPTNPQVDLARCQRFYEIGTISSVNLPIANITAVRTEIDFAWNFSVTKRVAPTMTMTTTQSTQVQLAPGAFGTVGDSTSLWVSVATPAVDGFAITANRGSNSTYPTLQYSATWTASADF